MRVKGTCSGGLVSPGRVGGRYGPWLAPSLFPLTPSLCSVPRVHPPYTLAHPLTLTTFPFLGSLPTCHRSVTTFAHYIRSLHSLTAALGSLLTLVHFVPSLHSFPLWRLSG